MLPPYLSSAFHLDSEDGLFPWTEDNFDRLYQARMERGTLLIDLMLRDAGIASPAHVYPPTSAHALASLLESLLPIPRLERDLVTYYLVLDFDAASSDHSLSDSFASQRYLSPLQVSRIKGFWYADRGRFEDAVSAFSTPAVWSGMHSAEFLRECQDEILDLLASKSTSALVNLFLTTSNLPLDTPQRRQHLVRALALEQGKFYQAWRYVRDLEFESDMGASGELDIEINMEDMGLASFEEDGELALDGESKAGDDDQEADLRRRALLVQQERPLLLSTILEAVLIRKLISRQHFAVPLLTQAPFTAHPDKAALQSLLKLPIDNYEQKFLTTYLLNTTTSLPPSSFSLLHDLLTLRMCARGQHALAVEIDRQVAERIREQPQLGLLASQETRGAVREMINLLPEVQRKMLLVERDAAHAGDAVSERTENGATRREDLATTTGESATQADRIPSATRPSAFTRPSFAPLSASNQLRQASNSKVAMYQAFLRPTPSTLVNGDATTSNRAALTNQQTFLPSDHVAASSRRMLNASTNCAVLGSSTSVRNGMSVPFGGQQTQFPSSPFNFPPRVPVGYSALSASQNNASPVYPSIRRFGSDHVTSTKDGSQTPRALSENEEERSVSPTPDKGVFEDAESVAQFEEEEERATTPVAREPPATKGKENAESGDRQRQSRNDDRRHGTEEEVPDNVSSQDYLEEAPTQHTAPTKTPRGKRTRSAQPTMSPPATRQTAKTPARTRKQKQQLRDDEEVSNAGDARDAHENDHDVPIPGAFPTPRRAKRKLRSSSQFEARASEESDIDSHLHPPQAKRSRKGDTGAEAVRRATRSQSVLSQATTEADQASHVGPDGGKTPKKQKSDVVGRTRGQPQRRSARLSESVAPPSPVQSVISEADSVTNKRRRASARKDIVNTRETRSSGSQGGANPATRGVRTRRQAAALEEQEEE
ncbi:hypothetical protein QFC21_006447 [Naganishia friedmannii]|uniref:Uncharacterized protein n=1 Tax=Naganishia friedmannii TaxID=89922 RepID=A0ACC2V436_9TREE|nr:hypothetical protein QFC21_006447 [Naganishia friedmannii]